jgi:hypothetical protein
MIVPMHLNLLDSQNTFSPPNLSHQSHRRRGPLQSGSVAVAATATLSAGNAALSTGVAIAVAKHFF